MLRKNVEDSDLLTAMQKSTGPMTVDEIAKAVGSMRHKISNQVLSLVSSGKIEEVKSDKPPVRFVYRQSGAPQTSSSVVKFTGRAPRSSDSAKAESLKAQVAKTVENEDDSILDLPFKGEANRQEALPESDGYAPTSASDARKKTILSLLTSAKQKEFILDKVSNCEDLLAELTQEGLIESDYIINEHVYMLTEKAIELFPELKKADADEREFSQVEEFRPETSVEQEGFLGVLGDIGGSAADHLAPDEPHLVAEEEIPVVIDASPAEVVEVAPRHAALAENQDVGLEREVVSQITSLVNKLLQERQAEMQEEVLKLRKDRESIAQINLSIKKAAGALQTAVDALNEASLQMDELQ